MAGERVDASVTELLARPAQPTRAEEDHQLLGARLVALQMAVAGGNRGEVEAHLIRAFDLPNPQSILDDVFGRGTDASKRVVCVYRLAHSRAPNPAPRRRTAAA